MLGDLRRAWGESSHFPVVSSAGSPKIRRAELRVPGPVELLPSAPIARERERETNSHDDDDRKNYNDDYNDEI